MEASMRWMWIVLVGGMAAAQDKPGEIELKVKVARQGARGTGIPGYNFQLKPALTLTGQAATPDALRSALEKGIHYVLAQQAEDGSWSLDDSQLSDLGKKSGFRNTARDSASPSVMTAIACMGLRWNQELAPDRIGKAVKKGLEYVLENAPKHNKDRYGIWNWAFCIEFLVDEFKRAKEPQLRARIKEAVQKIAVRLEQNQHPGALAPKSSDHPDVNRPLPEYKDEAAQRQASSKQVNSASYVGITPAGDGDEDEGVMIQAVSPNSPAAKGGMQPGDRVLEIDGTKIKSADQLVEVIRKIKPDTEVVFKVHRAEGEKPQPQDRPKPAAKIPADGGWSYYAMGAMSFATSTAVIALLDAREIGCEVPQDVIDRGIAVIQNTRLTKPGNEDGFGYHARAQGDLRGSIGRICSCELALLLAGKSELKFMERAIRIFVNMRQELDLVLSYPGNHVKYSFSNAAYYFLYAHYYSARALHSLKDEAAQRTCGAWIQEALLLHQLPTGTWHDHESWGQLYGTSMALMAFGQLKMVTPDAYREPIKSLGN
jgi:hypothetical protein